MSGDPIIGRALADIMNTAARDVGMVWRWRQRRASLPPSQRNVGRVVLGSGLCAGCGYVAFCSPVLLGEKFATLVAEFQRAPSDPPAVLVVWMAAAVIGAAYVLLGLRGAQDGPHSSFAAFWSAAGLIGGGWSILHYLPGLLADPWRRGVCVVLAVMLAVRFLLAVGLGGGNAQRAVARSMQLRNAPLRPARARRWWQFW
jgi:hypothetical protein